MATASASAGPPHGVCSCSCSSAFVFATRLVDAELPGLAADSAPITVVGASAFVLLHELGSMFGVTE